MNGRTSGDENGSFTRYPSKFTDNPSVIDNALCSESTIEDVKSFFVLPFTGLSDHCCISVTIKSNIYIKPVPPAANNKVDEKLNTKKFIFKYDKTRKDLYEKALRGDENVEKLRTLIAQTNMNSDEIDKWI